ncbi:Uncharacterized mitochondrial protein AtMg00310 [Linum grandiflorum]
MLLEPDSLVTRLYREKYFHSSDIITVQLGHRPSFVWRSLWNSLDLVWRGYQFCISNGLHINIWNDPWLPDPSNANMTTPAPPNTQIIGVHQLFNWLSHEWNTTRILQMFNQRDRELILSIPAATFSSIDQRIWNCSRNGLYTV